MTLPVGTDDTARQTFAGARSLVGVCFTTHPSPVKLDHLNLRVADAAACRDFYCTHFGFRPAFEAEGGYFVRNDDGFLLALVPATRRGELPEGFHVGFGAPSPQAVFRVHAVLSAAGVPVREVDDLRPGEDYVSFRCWDPDGTEVEVYWDGA